MATKAKTRIYVVAAKEAKNRFGELLDSVQRQPVIITKRGRPVARMIAFVDSKRFEEVEDEVWAEKSEAFMNKLRKKHALSKSR